MSLWPGEKLRYAETHFKFKLPWSLLYRPWPEIIFDMPFQVVPSAEPTLWIVIRDADRFPVVLESAEVEFTREGDATEARTFELNLNASKAVEFFPVPLGKLSPGKYRIFPKATIKAIGPNTARGKERKRTFNRWNLPGLRPQPLQVQVLAKAPPKAPGFAVGETHSHTHYSRDHVEFGASPFVFQQAAKSIGLDFVSCTDHAYDFAFTDEDYTKEALSPAPRFKALRDEVAALNNDDGSNRDGCPLMLAGEEVSAGNSKGENVHVTVMANDSYLPGLGDCGRYWLENKPTRKVLQIANDTESHCFAAHPFQQMGLLEKFIFRRGYWNSEDLAGLRGIQFWNGVLDEGFKLGREFWIKELGKGNFLLPIGGNDAHGDLNDTTAVDLPLISLKHSRDHVFGNVRTAIKQVWSSSANANHGLTAESLHKAFEGDNCYITNGPALWWERMDEANIETYSNAIFFHARNTEDYGGAFRYIRIYGRKRLPSGKFADKEELCLESVVAARSETDIAVNAGDYAYLRAECLTADGHFALTSAAKIEQE